MKIIITGNIGCGKSTVTQFAHQILPNYEVFDIDESVRNLYRDADIKLELIQAFGTSSKTEISDIVFFDDEAKNTLYKIMNPPLVRLLEQYQTKPNVIFDIPLYFECFSSMFCDSRDVYVICVTCTEEQQLERIKSRGGISEEKARTIMAQQFPLAEKAARSDAVIVNTGSKEQIFNNILILLTRIGVL